MHLSATKIVQYVHSDSMCYKQYVHIFNQWCTENLKFLTQVPSTPPEAGLGWEKTTCLSFCHKRESLQYLPAGGVPSEVAEGGGEPVVYVVEGQLLVRRLQDGLQVGKMSNRWKKILKIGEQRKGIKIKIVE